MSGHKCSACRGTGRVGSAYCGLCVKGARLRCEHEHRAAWRVVQYHCNFSAFSGYHYTPSDYSGIRCTECGRYWRTKAAYVETLPGIEKP